MFVEILLQVSTKVPRRFGSEQCLAQARITVGCTFSIGEFGAVFEGAPDPRRVHLHRAMKNVATAAEQMGALKTAPAGAG
jgi:hypothetical protein